MRIHKVYIEKFKNLQQFEISLNSNEMNTPADPAIINIGFNNSDCVFNADKDFARQSEL